MKIFIELLWKWKRTMLLFNVALEIIVLFIQQKGFKIYIFLHSAFLCWDWCCCLGNFTLWLLPVFGRLEMTSSQNKITLFRKLFFRNDFLFLCGVEISEQCFLFIHGSGHVMDEAKLQLWLPVQMSDSFSHLSCIYIMPNICKFWFRMEEKSAKS